ncbi:MAG: hypothetical protein QOJ73_1552 [Streptosporangiaceae bacterium]|nr:hypothetical protein [Streptosporangiaceae bacterium]
MALLRRHFVAVLVILVVAVGVEYSFKHSAPTYAEVGTLVFIPPVSGAHPNAYSAVSGSILEAAGTLAVNAMNPQDQQQVLHGGGNAAYDVELLNSYNLEYPNYSNAYLMVSTASTDPVAVHRTYALVTRLVTSQFQAQQVAFGAAPNNRIEIVMAGDSGPLVQQGSSKRALIGLFILTIVAAFAAASFLDRHPVQLPWTGRRTGAARMPADRAIPE